MSDGTGPKDRLRALGLDLQQTVRERDLAGTRDALLLARDRASQAARDPCRRQRYKYSRIATACAVGARRTELASRIIRQRPWWYIAACAWLFIGGFYGAVRLFVQMRIVKPLVPCSCPRDDKQEGATTDE